MEYLPDFSNNGLEANDNDERNKIPSAHENRLNQYLGGMVTENEADTLLAELQGNNANRIIPWFITIRIYH